MPSHRTGLLIIRAWREVGSAEPLRAQVRVTGDVSTGIDDAVTLVRSDAVIEVVEEWLRALLAHVDTEPIVDDT